MTITNIDPVLVLKDSYFARNFSEGALEAIGQFLDKNYGEIDYNDIDNILCNATVYDSIDEALEDYEYESIEELKNSLAIIPVSGSTEVVAL